jgi:hypothetical protein
MEAQINEVLDYSTTEQFIHKMIIDPDYLKDGYKILSNYQTYKNFYINLCQIIFTKSEPKYIKLSASVLRTFLTKNWSDGNYITTDEKLVNRFNSEHSKHNADKHKS